MIDRVLVEVERAADEIVEFAARLVRIPTINPPGDAYDDCARLIADELGRHGAEVHLLPAEGRVEHTASHPRVNVIGCFAGSHPAKAVHLNGHFDVVPPGQGWTMDPFGGQVCDGRLYGRGACDMKAGLAAAVFAAVALKRVAARLSSSIEISGTVDEESGGFAGVAWLAERGWISKARTSAVIIPEPFGVDRICVGHRGVYWFEVVAHGRTAHGSMPFLGVSAIDAMTRFLDLVRDQLGPRLADRLTTMPVVPEDARRATINANGIDGGQLVDASPSPCVADRCRVVFDRRFLPEEQLSDVREEIRALMAATEAMTPGTRLTLEDRMVVPPTRTPLDAPVIAALADAIPTVVGRPAGLVASPGTYDQKHVARIAGVTQCVAYGPGELTLAHQPDEYCDIASIIAATKVLALATLRLATT